MLGQHLYGRVSSGRYWLEPFRFAWKPLMLKRRRIERINSTDLGFVSHRGYQSFIRCLNRNLRVFVFYPLPVVFDMRAQIVAHQVRSYT